MIWLEVVKNDMNGLGLASADALNRRAWRRKIVDCVGHMFGPKFVWSSPGILPRMSRLLNGVCVCVCVCRNRLILSL